MLDSSILAPYVSSGRCFANYLLICYFLWEKSELIYIISIVMQYIDDDISSESESDEDNAESGEEGSLESEDEDDNDASNEEEWTSSTEAKSDASDNEERDDEANAVEALKKVTAAVQKLVPFDMEDLTKVFIWLTS